MSRVPHNRHIPEFPASEEPRDRSPLNRRFDPSDEIDADLPRPAHTCSIARAKKPQ